MQKFADAQTNSRFVMKRRQRRPVLELSKSQTGPHGEYMQNKCKQISKEYHGQSVPANPLANLLCHYNSDSDTEESKKDINNKLDDQVNNFLKEIQLIAPKEASPNDSSNATLTTDRATQPVLHANQQASLWQECLDKSTGYPYYWHIETNEVTWEMPSELRTLKNNGKLNPIIKPATSQESHWVDFSSIAYQQSHENIPEGMIPREVVARNRNRYMCGESIQKQKPPAEQDTANTSDAMDDDSDDGRIEMITSYGSDESDSDTENQSSNEAAAKPMSEPMSTKSTTKLKGTELPLSSPVILPQQLGSGSQIQEQNENESHTERDVKLPDDKETKYSKTSGKSHRSDGEPGTSSKENQTAKELTEETAKREPDLDIRISLVPGYDEDSDGEEEEEKKTERKCLFPIPQDETATESLSLRHKGTPYLNKPTLSDDNRMTDSSEHDANVERKTDVEKEEAVEKEPMEIPKADDEKSNMFLDTSHGRNKCFQRKRRIAFEVPLTKAKTTEESDTSKIEIEAQQHDANSCDADQDTEQYQKDPSDQQKEYTDFTEDTNESIKSSTKEASSQEDEEVDDTSSISKKEQEDVSALSQIISEKLKFLSEGKPGVSPVQMMAIQLQTLFIAWESGCLEQSYLRRWLTDTGHELERLEQDAAPPGWLCQWDRSHKRYYYQNATTGVTQWIYPDTGIAGGTEEMEICSTPPPADQEEIITSESDGIKKESNTAVLKKPENGGEIAEGSETRPADMEAPPPPQISNPSPPPPPRIFAEDLKKDKRRRDKNSEKPDTKRKRLEVEATAIAEAKLENPLIAQTSLPPQAAVVPNIGNTEPLPPGVDLPEAPYELPATALKRILYNTVQQGNALYDPTTREVPILGHPAAIVQEHYLQYPAYHQHIHAPAALVLPHKHAVQPAIQLIPDYTPIYTNHKVIEKPPVKMQKESLVSALDSFYSDIARIEKSGPEQPPVKDAVAEIVPVMQEETKAEIEQEQPLDNTVKEKRRKKTRIGISKKHKEVSSMVAKWQRALQTFEDNT